MSGILDSKTRILDTIITSEGRRQLANGELRIVSYSFSDEGTFYAADVDDGVADATVRLTLEHCNLPQDSVSVDFNDAGKVLSLNSRGGLTISNGQLFSQDDGFIIGDSFVESVDGAFEDVAANFRKLLLLSTVDELFDDSKFDVSNSSIKFYLTNEKPLKKKALKVSNVNSEETIMNDQRFSHVTNLKYLPPVTSDESGQPIPLGSYPKLRGQTSRLTASKLFDELKKIEQLGFKKNVHFEPTSKDNNLMVQAFEINESSVNKLVMINFPLNATNRKAFFVGKLFTNDHQQHVFMHVFTLIFRN